MSSWTLKDPLWLLVLLAMPLVWWLRGRRGVTALVIPFAADWYRPAFVPLSRWPSILASAGLILVALSLSRPQYVVDRREVHTKGYDLILAIDLSGSMLAEDYTRAGRRINRLEAIKPVIEAFINRRSNDRIGIVVFSGRAYTLSPLTFDHEWLRRQADRLEVGLIEDGTAIGDGLGVALTRLGRENDTRRQGAFIILLTDGANNRGVLEPLKAAEIARARKIPVYTIGAGRTGFVQMPIFDRNMQKRGYKQMLSELDESTLQQMALITGGEYFRADATGTVEKAFASIDRARKIEFQATSYLQTREYFWWLALPGAALLLAGAMAVRVPGRREVLA